MYLSKLELQGFKSFAPKTTLQFAPGITAIVGPNGCGKSNIIDAVRWVLGEQRARLLRSDRMENVIFNGTAQRRPLGMAEVSMVIENSRQVLPTPYTEVRITRRLYRSGESEYLLNGTVCRLRDIQELLMDSGVGAHAYSVIELGMIDDILSSDARERRRLFEEAAGVGRYKVRRTQTQRKLDQLQQDLHRIRDLVGELERQERSLSRQARKAETYKRLREELAEREQLLLRVTYTRLMHEHDRLLTREREREDACAALEARMGQQEAMLETLQVARLEAEEQLSEARQALSTWLDTLRNVEHTLQLLEQEQQHHTRTLARLAESRTSMEQRQSVLQTSLQELSEQQATLEVALETLLTEYQEAEARYQALQQTHTEQRKAWQEAHEQVRRLEQERLRLQEKRQALMHRLAYTERECAALDGQQQTLIDRRKELEHPLQAIRQQVAAAQTAVEEAEAHVQAQRAQAERLSRTLEHLSHEEATLSRQWEALQAEYHLLEELLTAGEALPDAVQHLLREDVLQAPLLTDVLSCPPEYLPALEAALGPWLSALVTSRKEALAALNHLHASEAGRGHFLTPPETPPVAPAFSKGRPASAVIHLRHPLPAVEALLAHGWVVDTREEALEVLREAGRAFPLLWIVTPEGDSFHADGRMAGGGSTALSAPLQRMVHRARLEELQAEREALQKRLEDVREQLERTRRAREAVQVEAAYEALRQAEQRLHEAEQRLHHLLQEKEHLEQQDERLRRQQEALADERERLAQEIQPLEALLAQTEATLEQVREQTEALETRLAQTAEELQRLQEVCTSLRVERIAQESRLTAARKEYRRLEDERQRLQERLTQEAEERNRLQEALRELEHRQMAQRARRDALLEERAQHEENVQVLESRVLELRNGLSEAEQTLRTIRREHEQHLKALHTLQTQRAEIHARIQLLHEQAAEAEYPPLDVLEAPLPDTDAITEEVSRLKQRIRNLGAINELALESYREVRERLDFLTEQLTDLEEAERSLKKTIRTINATASERFEQTFATIRKHFQELFRVLFDGKGEADLQLQDPDDPLESPIEIVAHPGGKKPVSLAQLSGGEKTLTAIALLFAIYLVKPSPFCILDEVDAPLDDANILRFTRLLRRFTDRTQFILVTHNKRTMEAADQLYGVTMSEEGVSLVVPVSFDRAEDQLQEAASANV